MNGQPDSRFARRRPFDSVPSAGGDVDPVAGLQIDHFIFEAESGGAAEKDDPFGLRLIVPETLGRGLAVRNYPLDPAVCRGRESLDKFLRKLRRDAGEEVSHRINESIGAGDDAAGDGSRQQDENTGR